MFILLPFCLSSVNHFNSHYLSTFKRGINYPTYIYPSSFFSFFFFLFFSLSHAFIHLITHSLNKYLLRVSTVLGTKDTEIEFILSIKYYIIDKVARIN